jgi:hypothetical protein
LKKFASDSQNVGLKSTSRPLRSRILHGAGGETGAAALDASAPIGCCGGGDGMAAGAACTSSSMAR